MFSNLRTDLSSIAINRLSAGYDQDQNQIFFSPAERIVDVASVSDHQIASPKSDKPRRNPLRALLAEPFRPGGPHGNYCDSAACFCPISEL